MERQKPTLYPPLGVVTHMTVQHAAFAATLILGSIIGYQLLLAAGLPLGRAAWGGEHIVLPRKLRWGSLLAACILAVTVWIILARADLLHPGAGSGVVRIGTWIFALFFCLNTLGNLASKSVLERKVMTPLTVVLAACFFFAALS